MDQEDKIIVRPTIDSIPEDVVLAIVKFVNKWAEVRDIEEDSGRISRNSTLRAVSLTSRKAFDLWYPPLIENVTVGLKTVVSLYRIFLENRREHIKGIKLLRCVALSSQSTIDEETFNEVIDFANLSPSKRSSMDNLSLLIEGVRILIGIAISEASNLTTLIFKNFHFVPSNLLPLLSLSTCSIKKLYLGMPGLSFKANLTSAKNVVWLLVFCQNLKEISVGFTVSKTDFQFLDEFKTTFEGLSNVTKLAIGPRFMFNPENPRSWWIGNKKTMAISNLLLVTQGLTSLEFHEFDSQSPNDDTEVYSSCLMSLSKSFHSLKHLRISHTRADPRDPYSPKYSAFKTLRIFLVDCLSLSYLLEHEAAKLPSSIEVLYLSCYVTGIPDQADKLSEERNLAFILRLRSFPNLREVVVPTELIGFDGRPGGDAEDRVTWAERRKDLEALEIFKEGKVKLIKERPGPFTRTEAEDEICLSNISWQSPWN